MIALAARNPSEWTGPTGNTTYLFAGPSPFLIDAGVGHPDHIAAIEAALAGRDLDLVLITHAHADHSAGVPALSVRWPGLVVRGGPGQPLRDGELFDAGGTSLRAVHTPGHAPDHFCFLDEAARDLYCGDLARLGGTIVIPASRGGSLRDYLQSLRRVRDLNPERLLPAHGPVVSDPVGLIDEYLTHRAARGQQVLQACKSGHTTPEAIVAHVYPDLPPSLRDAARETVLAHLQKLREDGVLGP